MKVFTLFWLDGTREAAMNNAGYGAGALRALDFYAEGDDNNAY